MFIASWLSEAAPVASAAFTAIAAGASLAAVRQARRIWRQGRQPQLHAQVLAYDQPGENIALVIHNGGGGLAKGVGFVLWRGNQATRGYVGDGLLRPGETVHLRTELVPHSGGAHAVIFCRDAEENTFAWDPAGHPWSIPRRDRFGRERTTILGFQDFVRHFHPDVDLTNAELRRHMRAPSPH